MLRYCMEDADRWRMEIKVAHHVVPHHRTIKKSISSASKKSDLLPSSGIPTLKSQISNSSKKSSTSSMSSNPFKKLWGFHKARKMRPTGDGSETADEFERFGLFRKEGFSQMMFAETDHIYESIPRVQRRSRYLLSRDLLGFKGACEFEPGDDGYGTSHLDSDSVYDSIS